MATYMSKAQAPHMSALTNVEFWRWPMIDPHGALRSSGLSLKPKGSQNNCHSERVPNGLGVISIQLPCFTALQT